LCLAAPQTFALGYVHEFSLRPPSHAPIISSVTVTDKSASDAASEEGSAKASSKSKSKKKKKKKGAVATVQFVDEQGRLTLDGVRVLTHYGYLATCPSPMAASLMLHHAYDEKTMRQKRSVLDGFKRGLAGNNSCCNFIALELTVNACS